MEMENKVSVASLMGIEPEIQARMRTALELIRSVDLMDSEQFETFVAEVLDDKQDPHLLLGSVVGVAAGLLEELDGRPLVDRWLAILTPGESA